ncbi:Uncharacterised protein [Mycobacteroides abscessus subsp. massiliense]|nr:Uncharacterised protein [Mycobacteroides abscessus subsp. massiliense]
MSDHRCLGHSVERCQRRLDLAELDTVSANLDLLIGATQIPQLPAVIPLDQVPGAIHAGAGLTEGAGHEARRRQSGPAPIAQAYTATRHIQLSGHTGRGWTHPLVQYEQSHSRHRGTDQYRPSALQWCAYRRIYRGLRRPVGVDHHPSRRPAVHQFGWASLSRHHQCRRFQPLRRDHPGCRRCLTQYAHVLRDKQLMKFPGRCRHLFRHHQQARAVQQRTEDFPYRDIEAVRMPLRPYLTGAGRYVRIQCVEQPGHISVRNGNTFWCAGGSRGEDDVRDVVGRRARRRGPRLYIRRGLVDIDDAQLDLTKTGSVLRGGDGHDRRGIGHHELDAGEGKCRIHRHIGRTGFQYSQHRDNGLCGPGEQQRHRLARACSTVGEHAREAIGGFVEFSVGHRSAVTGHRDRARRALNLLAEQLRN